MPKRYRSREVIRVLRSQGWQTLRTRGSHVRLAKPDGRNPVTVPVVKQEVDPKTFASILKQAGVSRWEFEAVAEEVL